MQKMAELVRQLEVSLGPETADLCMRYGLHSGPVTAGVLRGEKSRFQLFGDTVNFASRMESTGQRNRIQCSEATADLLVAGGKKHWIHLRDELVHAKGKGNVQTYWIIPRSNSDKGANGSFHNSFSSTKTNSIVYLKCRRQGGLSSHHSLSRRRLSSDHTQNASRRSLMTSSQHVSQLWSSSLDAKFDHMMEDEDFDGFEHTNRQERLIEWNVEILADLLRRIVAHRQTNNIPVADPSYQFCLKYKENHTALDELTEIIPLGGGGAGDATKERDNMDASMYLDIDPDTIVLPKKVGEQLRDYVNMVAW
jgi:Adenylate and Guanylate cyclase catalytic domain